MIIERLRLSNFKTYEELDIDLGNRMPGVYFVQGENLFAPDLGGNGVGKSGMWDGLCWVLYGKSVRGLTGAELLRWNGSSKGYSGIVDLQLTEETLSVKRTWNPNSLQWSRSNGHWETVDQNTLVKHLRLTYQAFLHSVILGQFSEMFLEIPAAEKESLFSAALDLDSWLELSAKAKDKAKAERARVENFRRQLEKTNGELDGIGMESLEAEADKWDSQNKKLLESNSQRAARLQEKLEGAEKRLERYTAREERAKREERAEEGLEKQIRDTQERLRHADGKLSWCDSALDSLSAQKTDIIDAYENGGICYLCGSDITEDHLEKELRSIERKMDNETSKAESEEAKVKQLRAELKELETTQRQERRLHDKRLRKMSQSVREAQEDVHALQMDIKDVEADCKRLSLDNPYLEMIERNRVHCAGLRGKQKILRQLVHSHRAKEESSRYWVNGFKAIRLQLIAESLEFLEIEVENSLKALGLDGWHIRFGIDRETKKGTLKKGFNVFVRSPETEKEVRWESWSGGESQRMVLAGQLGLGNLIQSLTGAECNLEVYDEPTNYLSPEGIEDLLTRLQERAEASQKVIFLLDHRTLDFGGFAGKLVVRKLKGGGCEVIEETLDNE